MITAIIPKLPMRNKTITKAYYIDKLGFSLVGSDDFDFYLMVEKDGLEIHFFEFKDLDIKENDGQIYLRTNDITRLYQHFLSNNVEIHPNGPLSQKPWGQMEFALLDPDHNLLTFGQEVD